MKIKVLFLGNPTISVSALQSLLLNDKFEVVAAVTSCDKAVGRSHSNTEPTPVAVAAEENNIKVIKSNNINKDIDKIKELGEFDIALTTAFGQYLSNELLALPKFKALNVHGSLLPEGRGGAPIHWAIIKGKKVTGVSMMEMIDEMDAGDFYTQDEIIIDSDDTYDSLYNKMSDLIGKITADRLLSIYNRDITSQKQDESLVSKWLNITKEAAKINFDVPASDVYNQIRGLSSKPGAWCEFNNVKIKVNASRIKEIESNDIFPVGKIISITQEGILVAVADKTYILLTNITLPGKKSNDVSNLLNGNFKKIVWPRT